MQIFTKQANRWAERECIDDECRAFAAALGETFVNATAAHDSYLINLASPDPVLRMRSLESFIAELRRAERLTVDYLVSHPGNYMDDRESGISRNAEAIAIALERGPGRATLLMELTAGSGTSLGSRFEDMAALLEAIPPTPRARVGVCLDTAHVWASGYDLADDYEGVWEHFGDVLGMERLRLLHLNDSKVALGSRRDRHELIGQGAIGERAFRQIMNDPRFANVPKVIETPKLGDAEKTDRLMLERLRSYVE
jgi:deoxyribonuclease-4